LRLAPQIMLYVHLCFAFGALLSFYICFTFCINIFVLQCSFFLFCCKTFICCACFYLLILV
jgi:hypothetical protein